MSAPHESIRTKIADEMKNISPKIEVAIVNHLTDKEKTRRADAWLKVFDQLDKAEKEHTKIARADVINITYNDKGQKEQYEAFSPARVKEIEKLDERITKLKNALNKSLEKGEWKDVFDLANQQPKPDAKSDGKDTETS